MRKHNCVVPLLKLMSESSLLMWHVWLAQSLISNPSLPKNEKTKSNMKWFSIQKRRQQNTSAANPYAIRCWNLIQKLSSAINQDVTYILRWGIEVSYENVPRLLTSTLIFRSHLNYWISRSAQQLCQIHFKTLSNKQRGKEIFPPTLK